ncbi:hypothetical protein [Actinoplanes sp. NPDC049681]|uniref:hypothetical protein n=1 Tax=Actinoplanes sp. NPDC049681 TaxID=3363905 RepID=UPI00379CA1FA
MAASSRPATPTEGAVYAELGTEHIYPSCSWFDDESDSDLESATLPDAARWPGHPIDDPVPTDGT